MNPFSIAVLLLHHLPSLELYSFSFLCQSPTAALPGDDRESRSSANKRTDRGSASCHSPPPALLGASELETRQPDHLLPRRSHISTEHCRSHREAFAFASFTPPNKSFVISRESATCIASSLHRPAKLETARTLRSPCFSAPVPSHLVPAPRRLLHRPHRPPKLHREGAAEELYTFNQPYLSLFM